MTAQVPETLKYKGQELALTEEPLNDYLFLSGVKLELESPHTGLWRGYVGSWEIIDDRLYLTGLRGTFSDGSCLTLANLFPDFPGRVFAHWYTGTLRIPQGRQLKYVHMGYASVYERDLLLDVERGAVVKTTVRRNSVSADDHPRENEFRKMIRELNK
jgi:hypothetical protein